MCTAISVIAGDNYFGRNLDYESDFGEKIVITPRKYCFSFSCGDRLNEHYAIIGMAVVGGEYPLYFDATNEAGLSMAGLRFAGNAVFNKGKKGKKNIASFEFIPWVLSKCKSIYEAERLVENVNITDDAFSEQMPPAPLHWIIADRNGAITVEQTVKGLNVYQNPVGVLTNNPEFDMQLLNLANYMTLSAKEPESLFTDRFQLESYSRGMGAMGLPGDLSSMSRFIKASFICENSVYSKDEESIVNHFFHTLYSVYQQKGCVRVGNGFEITNYTSCCNASRGIYYYTTYENSNINAVDMHRENLDKEELMKFELIKRQKVNMQN